ncbi:MAG: sodium-dependent transporter [Pseudomonadales bacterium]
MVTAIWSGRLAFILASIGAAVGLGNIWKFPYTLGNSGGSAFVLVYVAAILLVATPIMLSEMIIGRRARHSAPTAMRSLAIENNTSPRWALVGWMGQLANLLVLSFYSVIAGWTGAYLVKFASGRVSGLPATEVAQNFDEFLRDPGAMIFWTLLFIATTIFIVSRGVQSGLERYVKILMPLLFLTLVALVINAAVMGDFSAALAFLFSPDISKLTPAIVLAAVGQAFFSVNVGVGAVLTYSAYLPKDVNLFRSAITISLGDTLVALLAGLAIFPIVFANNMDPAEGPGLVFVTLSTAFAQMPGGTILGTAFFVMLLFAALTSSIAMLETMTARVSEIPGVSRTWAALAIGTVAFLLGLVTVFSFSSWEHFYPLGAIETFATKTPFDLIDYLVTNILMPIGGVLYAIFAGWRLSKDIQVSELGVGDGGLYKLWLLLARVVAPMAVVTVFLFNL